MVAMAMQESRHMDVEERDKSKDFCGNDSANATIFNISKVRPTACRRSCTAAVHACFVASYYVMTRLGSA
jgi:hypothetical protein